MRPGAVAAAMLAGLVSLPAMADDLYAAIARGDTRAAVAAIPQLYEAGGASWFTGVEWTFKPSTHVFNSYDPVYEEIVLGAMPRDAEVVGYWDNWSRALTADRWDWRPFFADIGEAALLARYNQFVLGLHEAGHALKYRYDAGHFARHGHSVNCREFYADILTAGVLDTLVAKDARFARLEARYLELMQAIDATMAEEHRYAVTSARALIDDCALIEVAQPTPEDMAAYAAAFFARQTLLMSADLPPLTDIVATYLQAYMADPFKGLQRIAEALPVTTAQRLGALEFRDLNADSYWLDEEVLAAFAPDGTLYVATVDIDRGGPEESPRPASMRVRFGLPGQQVEVMPLTEVHEAPAPDIEALSAVALGPASLVVLMLVDDTDIGLLRAELVDGAWQWGLARPMELRYPEAKLSLTPGGKLQVIGGPFLFVDTDGPILADIITIDPGTLAVIGTERRTGVLGDPRILDDEGNLYGPIFPSGVLRQAPDGTAVILAGSGLRGQRDAANGHEAEFNAMDVENNGAFQLTTDNRILLVDSDPVTHEDVVRAVDLTPLAR